MEAEGLKAEVESVKAKLEAEVESLKAQTGGCAVEGREG